MNSALHSFGVWWPWTTIDVLNHLWQSTAVGLVVLTVLGLGRGLSARTRSALGWMALVKFVLPTGFVVHAFAHWGATPVRWVASGALTNPMVLPAFVATATAPLAEAPDRLTVGLALALVWLVGFASLLGSWLVRGRILRRQILAEMQPVSGALGPRIEAAARRVGLIAAPRCWSIGSARAPGVLGIIVPVVIVPRGLETMLTPAELDAVLIHEFVHVQRRDNIWTALQAVFGCLLWFHPVVWLLNRRLALETEQSCDERVLEITGDPDTYAGGIVKAVQHALGLAQPGLLGATTPPIITRLKNILSHGAQPDRPLVRGAALAGGALVIALSGYAGSFAAPALSPVVSVSTAEAAVAAPVAPTENPSVQAVSATSVTEPTQSIDFSNEEIRRIIGNVADLFHLDVTLPNRGLKEKATVKLRDATWRQIFRVALTPAGFTFVEEKGTVRIFQNHSESISLGDQLRTDAERLRCEAAETQSKLDALKRSGDGKNVLAARTLEREATAQAAELAAVDARSQALYARVKALEAKDVSKLQHPRALTVETPLAMASLPALAAQADHLKRKTETLQQENDVDRAAHAHDSEAKLDPEASRPKPDEMIGSSLDDALVQQAQSEADAYRASVIKVFEPNELDRVPVPTYQRRPNYPFALRRAMVSGEATVDFIVDDQGKVMGAYAVKYSHVEFAEAATEAVAKWQFKPGRKNGEAVNAHLRTPIVFSLDGR